MYYAQEKAFNGQWRGVLLADRPSKKRSDGTNVTIRHIEELPEGVDTIKEAEKWVKGKSK